jgi:pimeloyl-ACP methyl ester carboxylesterase
VIPRIAWRSATVEGRPARYGRVGDGPPLVFLHGWGLTARAYQVALVRLAGQGVTVWAPALPGFGGTAPLPDATMPAYAAWVDGLLDAVGLREQVILMGHSFGGGVAIQVAHDLPDRVRSLVLVNSIGGTVWRARNGRTRTMADRPLWDWGLRFPFDVLRPPRLRVLSAVLRDYARNLVHSPASVVRAAAVARSTDLSAELEELRRRRLPIVVLWGEQDRIVTRASFHSLLDALGNPDAVTVPGSHSWMLADPDAFGDVMTNVLDVARRRRWRFPPSWWGRLRARWRRHARDRSAERAEELADVVDE